MSKIYNNYVELVGHTPLLRLNHYEKIVGAKAQIIAKLENFNPLSSVKDRLAKALIEAMEEKGLVHENTKFIEPTSGNTGIGLAFICAARQYDLTLVMPESVSNERKQIVRALGAKLILTDKTKGMLGSIAKAKEMIASDKNYIMPMQFENLANPEIHRKTTAIEIINDTDGDLDFFVAGIGTGGTITGTGEVLKQRLKDVKVIAVEPATNPFVTKGFAGSSKIQGIGPGFLPGVVNKEVFDDFINVEDKDAFETSRLLAKSEGVLAGISAGAALFAATQIAIKEENKGKKIVVIIPDTGERYLSTELFE
ncbi:cysteine synthase A [Mycoplasmatota bacterium]|nr:cysteine synthase A [Mycoplasmatota bacterium]